MMPMHERFIKEKQKILAKRSPRWGNQFRVGSEHEAFWEPEVIVPEVVEPPTPEVTTPVVNTP